MSVRGHLVTKKVVEYDGREVFNNNASLIEDIIRDYIDDDGYFSTDMNGDNVGYWEIDKFDFSKAVMEIKGCKDHIVMALKERLKLSEDKADSFFDDMVNTFVSWIDLTPKQEDFIRVEWF